MVTFYSVQRENTILRISANIHPDAENGFTMAGCHAVYAHQKNRLLLDRCVFPRWTKYSI